ncbi:hypothetical protein D4764_05G0008650 [Takifugu flavidus]|uniref:Uncharacterized protein n=1 Tax=Takifugu flavidus TaxID=433684 RepID=A0A5C6N127_9TELE|nr:hypothetical protein D4764_05G0008650 [Takifugu flavidus]
MKQITTYYNQMPWMNKEVRLLLRARNIAFRSGIQALTDYNPNNFTSTAMDTTFLNELNELHSNSLQDPTVSRSPTP